MYGNPFSSQLATKDLLLVGRQDILEETAQIISLPRPDHRDFHGLPEMGKSTLLRFVARDYAALDSAVPDKFIELFGESLLGEYKNEPHRLFRLYLSGWLESVHPFAIIYREFYRQFEPYREKIGREHGWQLPTQAEALGLSNGNGGGSAVRPVADDDGDGALERLEPHIRALAEAGMRPVFLLDDFANENAFGVLSADQTGRLATWMPYCAFIFATERLLEKVNPNARKGSPLFMRLPQSFIREYEQDEARRFLAEALKDSKASLPKQDVDFLLNMAGGFPYLLLLGGRALWDMRRRLGLSTAPDATDPLPPGAQAILYPRLGAEFGRSFATYWRVLDPDQQADLVDLAHLRLDETEKLAGDMSPRENRLSLLEQYGLVDMLPELRVRLFSPLFADYVRTQRPVVAGDPVPSLTDLQANLYNVFRNRPEELLTFAELGHKVWDWPFERRREIDREDKRKIHIAVSKLRRQLEELDTGERIISLRSKGYRFVPGK